jgi:hypothetical protein
LRRALPPPREYTAYLNRVQTPLPLDSVRRSKKKKKKKKEKKKKLAEMEILLLWSRSI